jgi:hypothetical protein
MTVAARLMREECVALFIAEVGNVYDGNRVGGNELQRLAGSEKAKFLAGLEHGQRTKKAYGIEFMFHGTDYIAAPSATCYAVARLSENVMPLMTKLSFTGRVEALLTSGDRKAGLEKSRVGSLALRFDGIEGDCHSGPTRPSDSRTIRQYPRNTPIRNVRQLTLLSVEELAEIARLMEIPEVKPEWVGANVVISGIPDLTFLPPSSRLQFPSGATIVVDMENEPCRYPAEIIEKHNPAQKVGFVRAAKHKRGVTAWVEREGEVRLADEITLWIPPQRLYKAGAQ